MPLTDPLLARLVVPVAVTVAVAVLVRLVGGSGAGNRAAAVAVPAGLVAGYAVLPGWSWAPPTDAVDKLAWLAVGGGLLGVLVDLTTRGRIAATIAALLWPAVAIAWLAGPSLLHADSNGLYRFGEVSVVLGVILARLEQLEGERLSGPVTASVIAAEIAALGLVSGAPELAAINLPMAAAGLGWIVCNWPRRRLAFGAAGLLGGSGIALASAGYAALLTTVNSSLVLLVLAAVLLQPVATALTARVPGLRHPMMRPFATALVVAIPSVAAVLLARFAPTLIPSIY